MVQIPLRSIKTDTGIQQRANTLDNGIVSEYAAAMQAGAIFPPVTIFSDGTTNWLADGFHRVEAADEVGAKTIAAEIRQGTRRDAILYACAANRTHGLRRTREDMRRAIATLLADDEWRGLSDRAIAQKVGCDHKTVAPVRSDLGNQLGNFPSCDDQPVIEEITDDDLKGIRTPWAKPEKRIGKDGKARSAPKQKPIASPPPRATKPAPAPKVANRAVLAMQIAHHLAAALVRLDEVIDDLLPSDAATVISNLGGALAKLEARFGTEGTCHA